MMCMIVHVCVLCGVYVVCDFVYMVYVNVCMYVCVSVCTHTCMRATCMHMHACECQRATSGVFPQELSTFLNFEVSSFPGPELTK